MTDEVYVKDTLTRDQRFFFEVSGCEGVIMGILESKVDNFKNPGLKRGELLDILKEEGVEIANAPQGNGHNYDFCLKVNGNKGYVNALLTKAGYTIVNGQEVNGAKEQGYAGNVS